MGKIVAKIVLTGGPCAGKTTALSKVEQSLSEQGYHVLMVSEGATELINGGIRPFGDSFIDIVNFEELIIKYQLMKEKLYEQSVSYLPEDTKCVIVYDRGANDAKGYINQDLYNKLLAKLNLHELDLLDNYDKVIHLVTAADGKEEYYTLDNNGARTETVEEAIDMDRRTINAWSGHNNFKIIDNSTDFDEKINKVIEEINILIGNPIKIKKQSKYLVDLKNSDLSSLNDDNSTSIKIDQVYLESNDNLEKRLRKRTYKGNSTYYFTVQKKLDYGNSKIITDKKISEKDYYRLLSSSKIVNSVSKLRISFTKNKQYFKLDIFDDLDLCVLEVEPTLENSTLLLPDFISVIEDVTNDKNYYNIELNKDVCNEHKLLVR